MNLSSKSTYEDILNFKRDEIKAYLKSVNEKVSGSKDELARRAHDYNQKQRGIEQSVLKCDQSDNILAKFDDCKAPSIAELTMGWTSDLNDKTLPPVTHKDVETYLIKSSHRTCDSEKMACYRQYIQGHKFSKEKYIHKIMVNTIADDNPLSYIRSKCSCIYEEGGIYTVDPSVKDESCIYHQGQLYLSSRVGSNLHFKGIFRGGGGG